MKRFNYRVFDDTNRQVAGVVEANNQAQAVGILRGKKLTIVGLTEMKGSVFDELIASAGKPKFEEITNFTRQLSTMIASGLPLVEALRILKDQSRPQMAKVVEQILNEIEGGSSLGAAMEKTQGTFSTVYVALVKAGESAGVLDQIMKKMADTLDKQREFQNKTRGALIYPTIVFIGMITVAFIMMIFVVPKLTQMYQDFGAELPLPTKILIGVSNFMVNYWYLFFGMLAASFLIFRRWSKTPVGSLLLEQVVFKIPIWGPLKKDIVLAEFSRTMGLLSTAAIPILDGLRIVAETLGSQIYADGIIRAAVRVEKGSTLAEAIAAASDFPPILSQMIAVGEQTGKVDEILSKLADFYESQSELKVKALTTAIEPIIMVIMGIGVGFLVMAVIMPIYQLTNQF
ncbi:MAG TPA: type II secretion system F family protein [Patescibacteria group bacterium]|nr:type II secretion system F family protein [Patescibacteria group bacterium]